MRSDEISIGARVVYAPPGPRRQRAGIVTGLAQSGRGLRAKILLDDGGVVVCPLNLVQPVASVASVALQSVRCSVCRRVCGMEWHETAAQASAEADASGWTQSAVFWGCQECQ